MLTLLVPIFGREEFTSRLRANAGAWLHTFEASFDMAEFHRRMLAELRKVKTPYAMIGDNDDLVAREGCKLCMAWLNGDPSYVAAMGRIEGFRIKGNKPYGKVTQRTADYTSFGKAQTFAQTSPINRVLAGFANESLYYAIHRTEILVSIWEDVVKLGLEDYQTTSKFCSMAVLKRGKVIGFDEPYYLRQYGTYIDFPHRFSFPGRLMTNNFTNERDAILSTICGDDAAFRAALVDKWIAWWEAYLLRNYGPWVQLRRLMKRKFPRLAWAVQNRNFQLYSIMRHNEVHCSYPHIQPRPHA